jgi:hypothetical protein
VKDFLDRLVSLTTDEMRRKRFEGLTYFEFTVNQGASSALPTTLDDDDEVEEEEDDNEVTRTAVTSATGRGRRSRTNSG